MDTPLINDLNICVATENGSGSASSNNILFKAIFKMGIPCSSKNMFPSNIQGLPTWYQIRASADGYLSRKDVIDVMERAPAQPAPTIIPAEAISSSA